MKSKSAKTPFVVKCRDKSRLFHSVQTLKWSLFAYDRMSKTAKEIIFDIIPTYRLIRRRQTASKYCNRKCSWAKKLELWELLSSADHCPFHVDPSCPSMANSRPCPKDRRNRRSAVDICNIDLRLQRKGKQYRWIDDQVNLLVLETGSALLTCGSSKLGRTTRHESDKSGQTVV